MKCEFCELPEVKERKIAENSLAWAFLAKMPIILGHSLIIPKRCIASFDKLTPAEQKAIFQLAKIVKSKLKNFLKAEGFNCAWNEELVAGQTVSHFHLHIVPRKKGDKGIYGYDARKFLYRPGSRPATAEKELAQLAKELRTADGR